MTSKPNSQRPAGRAQTGADVRVHAALLFVAATFGGFHVVARALLGELSPLTLAALRVALATPILVAIAAWHDRFLPRGKDLMVLAGLGFLGVFANQILFVIGLSYTTATNAAILMPSIPVFAAAIGVLTGVERLSPRRLAGIASTVAGALVMLETTRLSSSGGAALGNLLVLTNCLCFAAYLVAQRPVLERLPWRTVTAGAFVFGGAGILAVRLLTGPAAPPAMGGAVWLGVIYIVLLPTVASYSLTTWAVRRSSPALVAAYTTAQPLFAGLLAAFFLGENVGWRQALGFVLISIGLGAVSHSAPPGDQRVAPSRPQRG